MARRSSIRRDARGKRDASRYSIRRFPRSASRRRKVDESWRLIDERAVGSHAQARQRRGASRNPWKRDGQVQEALLRASRHKRLEIVQADVGVRIFRRNHLPCSVSLM